MSAVADLHCRNRVPRARAQAVDPTVAPAFRTGADGLSAPSANEAGSAARDGERRNEKTGRGATEGVPGVAAAAPQRSAHGLVIPFLSQLDPVERPPATDVSDRRARGVWPATSCGCPRWRRREREGAREALHAHVSVCNTCTGNLASVPVRLDEAWLRLLFAVATSETETCSQ